MQSFFEASRLAGEQNQDWSNYLDKELANQGYGRNQDGKWVVPNSRLTQADVEEGITRIRARYESENKPLDIWGGLQNYYEKLAFDDKKVQDQVQSDINWFSEPGNDWSIDKPIQTPEKTGGSFLPKWLDPGMGFNMGFGTQKKSTGPNEYMAGAQATMAAPHMALSQVPGYDSLPIALQHAIESVPYFIAGGPVLKPAQVAAGIVGTGVGSEVAYQVGAPRTAGEIVGGLAGIAGPGATMIGGRPSGFVRSTGNLHIREIRDSVRNLPMWVIEDEAGHTTRVFNSVDEARYAATDLQTLISKSKGAPVFPQVELPSIGVRLFGAPELGQQGAVPGLLSAAQSGVSKALSHLFPEPGGMYAGINPREMGGNQAYRDLERLIKEGKAVEVPGLQADKFKPGMKVDFGEGRVGQVTETGQDFVDVKLDSSNEIVTMAAADRGPAFRESVNLTPKVTAQMGQRFTTGWRQQFVEQGWLTDAKGTPITDVKDIKPGAKLVGEGATRFQAEMKNLQAQAAERKAGRVQEIAGEYDNAISQGISDDLKTKAAALVESERTAQFKAERNIKVNPTWIGNQIDTIGPALLTSPTDLRRLEASQLEDIARDLGIRDMGGLNANRIIERQQEIRIAIDRAPRGVKSPHAEDVPAGLTPQRFQALIKGETPTPKESIALNNWNSERHAWTPRQNRPKGDIQAAEQRTREDLQQQPASATRPNQHEFTREEAAWVDIAGAGAWEISRLGAIARALDMDTDLINKIITNGSSALGYKRLIGRIQEMQSAVRPHVQSPIPQAPAAPIRAELESVFAPETPAAPTRLARGEVTSIIERTLANGVDLSNLESGGKSSALVQAVKAADGRMAVIPDQTIAGIINGLFVKERAYVDEGDIVRLRNGAEAAAKTAETAKSHTRQIMENMGAAERTASPADVTNRVRSPRPPVVSGTPAEALDQFARELSTANGLDLEEAKAVVRDMAPNLTEEPVPGQPGKRVIKEKTPPKTVKQVIDQELADLNDNPSITELSRRMRELGLGTSFKSVGRVKGRPLDASEMESAIRGELERLALLDDGVANTQSWERTLAARKVAREAREAQVAAQINEAARTQGIPGLVKEITSTQEEIALMAAQREADRQAILLLREDVKPGNYGASRQIPEIAPSTPRPSNEPSPEDFLAAQQSREAGRQEPRYQVPDPTDLARMAVKRLGTGKRLSALENVALDYNNRVNEVVEASDTRLNALARQYEVPVSPARDELRRGIIDKVRDNFYRNHANGTTPDGSIYSYHAGGGGSGGGRSGGFGGGRNFYERPSPGESGGLSFEQGNLIGQIFAIPREALATADHSAILRQSLIQSISHPGLAFTAFQRSGKAYLKALAGDREYAQWAFDQIQTPHMNYYMDTAPIPRKVELYKGNLGEALSPGEEHFVKSAIETFPGVGRIPRGARYAYNIYLAKLRYDVFNSQVARLTESGRSLTANENRWLIEWINATTGRGNLGPFTESGEALAKVLFAPSLFWSRISAPGMLLNPGNSMPASIRRIAAEDTAKSIGSIATLVALGEKSGAYDVSWDPGSSDFGKIRIGNTRIDPWGGYQQIARFMAQIFSGKTYSLSGQQTATNVGQAFMNLLYNKMAPVPSLLTDIGSSALGNQRPMGQDPLQLNWSSVTNEMYNNLTPLFIQDVISTYKEQGSLTGAMLAVPAFFGVGIQSFHTTGEELNHLIEPMGFTTPQDSEGKSDPIKYWWSLDPYQKREAMKANPAIQKKYDESPKSLVGKAAVDRRVDLEKAANTFKESGNAKAYRETIKEISDKYGEEFAKLVGNRPDPLNMSGFNTKVNAYFDGLKDSYKDYLNQTDLTPEEARARYDFEYRRDNFSPAENAELDKILQSSDDPMHEELKTAQAFIAKAYWEKDENIFQTIKRPIYSGSPIHNYATFADLVRQVNEGDPNAIEVYNKVLNMKDGMNDWRQVLLIGHNGSGDIINPDGPKADAYRYLFGYSTKVKSEAAAQLAEDLSRAHNINRPRPTVSPFR